MNCAMDSILMVTGFDMHNLIDPVAGTFSASRLEEFEVFQRDLVAR